jgi:hypothetical protein
MGSRIKTDASEKKYLFYAGNLNKVPRLPSLLLKTAENKEKYEA